MQRFVTSKSRSTSSRRRSLMGLTGCVRVQTDPTEAPLHPWDPSSQIDLILRS